MNRNGIITTNSILDEFVAVNTELLARAERKFSFTRLLEKCDQIIISNSFLQSLNAKKKQGQLALIAEIKKASPALGEINIGVDIVKQAKMYEAAGASCISVLTQTYKFQGLLADLAQVTKAVSIPVLCKDFTISTYQILEAKLNGALAILLIVAMLSDELLVELYQFAYQQGLDVIVEVHTPEELSRAERLQPKILGVNSRNFKNMTIDLRYGLNLLSQISIDTFKLAESGINNETDAKASKLAGANGILVGGAIMKAAEPSAFIKKLLANYD